MIQLDSDIGAAESRLQALQDELAETERVWEADFVPTQPVNWSVAAGLVNHFGFDGNLTDSVKNTDAALDGKQVMYVAGQLGQALELDGRVRLQCRRQAPTLAISTNFPLPHGCMPLATTGP